MVTKTRQAFGNSAQKHPEGWSYRFEKPHGSNFADQTVERDPYIAIINYKDVNGQSRQLTKDHQELASIVKNLEKKMQEHGIEDDGKLNFFRDAREKLARQNAPILQARAMEKNRKAENNKLKMPAQ